MHVGFVLQLRRGTGYTLDDCQNRCQYPSDLSGISVESETFEFRNITSGMVTSFTTRKGITLPEDYTIVLMKLR